MLAGGFREHLVLHRLRQQLCDLAAQLEGLVGPERTARRMMQAKLAQRSLQRILLLLLAAVPPDLLRQRRGAAPVENAGRRLNPPLSSGLPSLPDLCRHKIAVGCKNETKSGES